MQIYQSSLMAIFNLRRSYFHTRKITMYIYACFSHFSVKFFLCVCIELGLNYQEEVLFPGRDRFNRESNIYMTIAQYIHFVQC